MYGTETLAIKLFDESHIRPGVTVYCKLTGKPMIIKDVIYDKGVNPQYVTQDRVISKLLVRYLSHKHDEFKTTEVGIFEISLTPINSTDENKQ